MVMRRDTLTLPLSPSCTHTLWSAPTTYRSHFPGCPLPSGAASRQWHNNNRLLLVMWVCYILEHFAATGVFVALIKRTGTLISVVSVSAIHSYTHHNISFQFRTMLLPLSFGQPSSHTSYTLFVVTRLENIPRINPLFTTIDHPS